MIKTYFLFSLSNLRHRRLRSWLTMLGIFIGISAVVSLISLGEGLREAIKSQFGFLGTDILSVRAASSSFAGVPGAGSPNPLSSTLAEKINKIKGVKVAFNRYIDSITMEFNNRQVILPAVSIPGGDTRKILEQMMNLKTEEGRLLKDGDGRKVLLGNNFKKENLFGKGIKVRDTVLINGMKFEVVGILKKKGSFLFDSGVIINEDVFLDEIRENDEEVNIIAIKVDDPNNIDKVEEDVEKLLRKERRVKEGEEDFVVETPQKTIETLNSTLFAVQLFVYIIAIISLLVGGIGIMNTMYTAVLERKKEIGIMKAVGAKNSTIFTLFFLESGMLGMAGGLIGIFLGLIFAYGLAAVGRAALGSQLIRAHPTFLLIFGSLLFSFFVGTIFGVLPALQASKLQPVESLRGGK